jgi:hypothetical protein
VESNEPSGFIKAKEFLDQLVEEGSAAWRNVLN